MEGEQWRRISRAEYAAAKAAASQRSSGNGSAASSSGGAPSSSGGAPSGSSGGAPSGSGGPASWSESESDSQGGEAGAAEEQQARDAPAAAEVMPAPQVPLLQAPTPPVAAAAAQPAPSRLAAMPADPYQFVPNSGLDGGDTALLPQGPSSVQQQQQRRQPAALGRRPLVPPPKFNQPAWQPLPQKASPLQQDPLPQPQLPQQQFSRKRKGAAGADAAQAPAAAAAEQLGQPGALAPCAGGFVPASQAPVDPMDAELAVAVGSEPLGTQGAADALFGLLQQRQPAGAAAGGGDFVTASQLMAGASSSPPSPAQQQQHAAHAEAAPRQRRSGKLLQDPGLFPSPAGAGAAGRHCSSTRNEGLHDPPLHSPGSQAASPAAGSTPGSVPAPLRSAADLFAGASPVAARAPASAAAQPAAARGAAAASDSRGAAGRRCLVISSNEAEIQAQVNQLQRLLGGEVLVQDEFQRCGRGADGRPPVGGRVLAACTRAA